MICIRCGSDPGPSLMVSPTLCWGCVLAKQPNANREAQQPNAIRCTQCDGMVKGPRPALGGPDICAACMVGYRQAAE